MAVISPQTTDYNGTTIVYTAAAAAGDRSPATDDLLILIKNGGGSAMTITVESPKPCDQGFSHDQPVTVPAGSDRIIGPFPRRFWTSDNHIEWIYSAVTSVTVATVN